MKQDEIKNLDPEQDYNDAVALLVQLDEVRYPANLHAEIMQAVAEHEAPTGRESLLERLLAPRLSLRLAFGFGCLVLLAMLFEGQPQGGRLERAAGLAGNQRGVLVGAAGVAEGESERIYASMAASNPVQGLDEVSDEEVREFLAALESFNRQQKARHPDENQLELYFVTDK
jgi:hypothetical protein